MESVETLMTVWISLKDVKDLLYYNILNPNFENKYKFYFFEKLLSRIFFTYQHDLSGKLLTSYYSVINVITDLILTVFLRYNYYWFYSTRRIV